MFPVTLLGRVWPLLSDLAKWHVKPGADRTGRIPVSADGGCAREKRTRTCRILYCRDVNDRPADEYDNEGCHHGAS